MLYLMTTPRVYQKLKAVVKEAIEETKVSNPIKSEEAKRIPYLQVSIYVISCAGSYLGGKKGTTSSII